MVVGRRRVAAASVATAYALHVYVLQHHFRPPRTDRPSLPLRTHPHCRKVGAQRSRSGYFSWVLVPTLPFLLPLAPSPWILPTVPHGLSRSTATLSTLRRAAHTPLAYVRSSFLLRVRRAGKRRVASYRTAHPPSHSGLSPSIRPLLAFSFFCSDFLPLSLVLLARLGPSQRPTPELK